jgi:hypothetical protein
MLVQDHFVLHFVPEDCTVENVRHLFDPYHQDISCRIIEEGNFDDYENDRQDDDAVTSRSRKGFVSLPYYIVVPNMISIVRSRIEGTNMTIKVATNLQIHIHLESNIAFDVIYPLYSKYGEILDIVGCRDQHSCIVHYREISSIFKILEDLDKHNGKLKDTQFVVTLTRHCKNRLLDIGIRLAYSPTLQPSTRSTPVTPVTPVSPKFKIDMKKLHRKSVMKVSDDLKKQDIERVLAEKAKVDKADSRE